MVVVVVVMMPITVGDDAVDGDVVGDDVVVRVHVQLSLPYSFKCPLNSPKYIFFNTGSAPVWILCKIICNRLVARIILHP